MQEKRINQEHELQIDKFALVVSVPQVTVWHESASLVITNCVPRDIDLTITIPSKF